MPPKVRITKDAIVEAAVGLVRVGGLQSINARNVARQIGCSTQPIMYQFDTMEALRQAAYERADVLHTEYLLNVSPESEPLLQIGLNYIRFAVEEPELFRFLFQSGYACGTNLMEMIDAPAVQPIVEVVCIEGGLSPEQAKDVFMTLAMYVHGYASLMANNAFEFDESVAAVQLERVFIGAAMAARGKETK